ncbi:MAG: sigma 54-interacting transcriptional regulator [Myxococcota bacterium]
MSDDPLATLTRSGSTKAHAPQPRLQLRVVHPTDLRWTHELPRATTVVGRIAADNITLALGHGTVSRRHFELRWDGVMGHHVGHDLGSHNGTRVNGQDIGSNTAVVRDGTVLQLGDVCLVVEQIPPGVVEPSAARHDEPIPGQSPSLTALRQAMAQAAPDPSPVLLLGETGTGKEHIAQEIHRLSSRPGPLVAINCSALSPQLIDSQLFGHVKGAFTGATSEQPGLFRAADGGTLFLDEIGDLPLPLQPKLLRALQEGEIQPVGSTKTLPVDVRVIAATHADLERRIEAGAFRRDLYARLALWQLEIPPLRARRGDLLIWLDRLHSIWLDRRPEHPVDTLTLSADSAEAVLLYDWPNNLRELDRLVHELASAPHMPRPIPRSRLPNWLRIPADPHSTDARITAEVGPPTFPPDTKPPVPSREEFIEVFERLGGNVRAMAKHFARDRRQIYRWIRSHGLTDRRPKRD